VCIKCRGYTYLKSTHVARVAGVLQAVLVAFHEKLEEKSATIATPLLLLDYTPTVKNVSLGLLSIVIQLNTIVGLRVIGAISQTEAICGRHFKQLFLARLAELIV